MTGAIFGRGYVPGLGEAYISQADRPDFLEVRVIKTGIKYLRRRKDIIFKPAKVATK